MMKAFKTFAVTQHQQSFPNYYAASEFSTLVTEYIYNILLILDYTKKRGERKSPANVFS